jgi:hypothetical protein
MNSLHARLLPLLVALSLVIAACGDDTPRLDEEGKSIEGTAEVDIEVSSPTFGIINLLRAGGNSVKVTSKVSRGSLKNGFAMKVNDAFNVEAFEFSTPQDRAEAEKTISADGMTIDGTGVTWGGDPHLYRTDRVILVYIGDDKENMQALEGSFDKEFAGKK